MGLETRTTLVCDRCGETVGVRSGTTYFDLGDDFAGWHRAPPDAVLCPECWPGYELMQARHRVEADDYVHGRRRE